MIRLGDSLAALKVDRRNVQEDLRRNTTASARLQRQIAAGAGGGEELQGTKIGSLEDGVADGFSDAAVLRFGSW